MNNLLYFNTRSVRNNAARVGRPISPELRAYSWFAPNDFTQWPSHITSRVGPLDTPWPHAPSLFPIPELQHNLNRFDIVMDSIASEQCREIDRSGKTPYICWSGGIDSTSILVSILKNAPKSFKEKLIVLHNGSTVHENAYFFHKFVHGKLLTQHIDSFVVDSNNFDKIVILDGECGNQTFGFRGINVLRYQDQTKALSKRPHPAIFTKLHPGLTPFAWYLINESAKLAPVQISSLYDIIWWTNFNFKFEDVLLRKFNIWTKNLTPAQCAVFWEKSLCRFYADPKMQIWSMVSKDQRQARTSTFSKYFAKKYIFDFDKNDLYYSNKRGSYSSANSYEEQDPNFNPIFAIDTNWNKYNFNDVDTQNELMQMLADY